MNLFGYMKMKNVTAYLDVYGEKTRHTTLLFDYYDKRKDILRNFNKIQQGSSVAVWRVEKEVVFYKHKNK